MTPYYLAGPAAARQEGCHLCFLSREHMQWLLKLLSPNFMRSQVCLPVIRVMAAIPLTETEVQEATSDARTGKLMPGTSVTEVSVAFWVTISMHA